MSQPTSGLPIQGITVPVRIPSASGILGTSSAAILAAAGPSHFDTTIGRGRERKGSDASESSASTSRIRTRRPTRGISANLSNSDENDSDAVPNIPRKSSQTQKPPTLLLPGRETSSPPTDRPLIRQAVAFPSAQPAVTNISTYEASPAIPQSKKKPVFLPGQAPAGTVKKPRGKRGASSAIEAREALQAHQNGEASGQPGPTITDGITATGRPRKQGAYPGQTMRFRVADLSADTTPKPPRQRKNAVGSTASPATATASKKAATPSPGLIDMPLKPGKGKERDTGIMNGSLGRMKLRVGQQIHTPSTAPGPSDMDNYSPVGDVPADFERSMGVDHEIFRHHPRSYSGSSSGPIMGSGSSTNNATSHKPTGSYYRRDYNNGTEILDLTEQRDSETPPPPLLLPTSSTPSLPSDRISLNNKSSRLYSSQPSSRPHDNHDHPQQSKAAANDMRLPQPTNSYSLGTSPRTASYPPTEAGFYDVQPPASLPPKPQHTSSGKSLQAQMDYSPASSSNENSPELQKRGRPRTVTVYICDFRTGQLDEQLVEVKLSLVPCSSPQEGYWADANDLCKSIQSSPSRIDGPAKAYTMRGTARQFILRVSRDNLDDFMHAKVLVQKDRSLRLTVELLQPVGSLPLPPPQPNLPYGNRYESYNRHSDRMDVDSRRYDNGPSPRPRYYHRKRPSSPSFDNYDGYSNQPSSSRHSSNKVPRNDYDWDMAPRHPPSDYYSPRSPSPSYHERGDHMDVDHNVSRRRPGVQHSDFSRRSRDDVYPSKNQAPQRPSSSRQFLSNRSHNTASRDPSLEPEFLPGRLVTSRSNPNERRRGHLTPEPMNGLRHSRSASPIESSEGGSSLDEADPFMGSVMKVLRLDQKLWDDFYAESTCSLPPVQHLVKKYDVLQKLLQKYTTTKVPGYEVVMEEKYILQIMWSGCRSKRGRARLMDELKEAIGLIRFYGQNGTRTEVPEVVRMVSEGDPAKTFEELAIVRKGLLPKLRRVHQEWESRQKTLETREHQTREDQGPEDQNIDSSRSVSLQLADPQVNAADVASDPSGSAAPISPRP